MELRAVRYEVGDGVATVMLDRPERLNAWTSRMADEYRWCLGTADADPEVRVIVVTGSGRGFCAGADFRALDKIADSGDYQLGAEPVVPDGLEVGRAERADFGHDHTFPLGLSKPVIAAVNGPAAGVGFVLMCFCDIRFAATDAKLTTSFGRLGLPAEHGVSWILPRLIGPARAADLLFSSRVVTGAEAAEMGLVNRAMPGEELLTTTLDYARTMAAEISPASLRMMKRQLYADLLGDLDTAATVAVEQMVSMIGEADFKEGVAAFQARRPPHFEPPNPAP